MGPGYWLNPATGTLVQVPISHNEWLRDRNNVKSIGLPDAVYDEVMRHDDTDIDAIRFIGLRNGLVRIRKWAQYLSIQFMVTESHVLETIAMTLGDLEVHPDTRLQIDNLLLNCSESITLADLESRLSIERATSTRKHLTLAHSLVK